MRPAPSNPFSSRLPLSRKTAPSPRKLGLSVRLVPAVTPKLRPSPGAGSWSPAPHRAEGADPTGVAPPWARGRAGGGVLTGGRKATASLGPGRAEAPRAGESPVEETWMKVWRTRGTWSKRCSKSSLGVFFCARATGAISSERSRYLSSPRRPPSLASARCPFHPSLSSCIWVFPFPVSQLGTRLSRHPRHLTFQATR